MSVYALIPLAATLAYIPLLVSTLGSRPWSRQHRLFVLLLSAGMTWSFTDFLFRSNFFPQYNLLLFRIILISFAWMAVQIQQFVSSFFPLGHRSWSLVAYVGLAAVILLVALGYIPEGVVVEGGKLYPQYGRGIILVAGIFLVLFARGYHVLRKRLQALDNPVVYNQTIFLLLSLCVLPLFLLPSLLPWGRELALGHLGNLIFAFMLSYATFRHRLVDVRVVLRGGLAWLLLAVIGGASYVILLTIFHVVLPFELSPVETIVATVLAVICFVLVYNLRRMVFATVGKGLHGNSYDYRQELSDFANKIHNVFSLKEQGGKLLHLVTRALQCKGAALLFPEPGGEVFSAQLAEPLGDNPLSHLVLRHKNPILTYLTQEGKPLTSQSLSVLPEFRGLWEQEREEIRSQEIELFLPLISRNRLVSVLVLGKKNSGRYTLGDLDLLSDVASRVAVSMEKEYLREQLAEREQELAIINRSSAIITSSLDVQGIFDQFIEELKKVADISWSAIVLISEKEAQFLALSSQVGSEWQVGERIPLKDTPIELVASQGSTVVVSDLALDNRFTMSQEYLKRGLHSIACLPLVVKSQTIGSLMVASAKPEAYTRRHIGLLEQLASQIAMPIENSRLYARAEEMARVDELTSLLNRRSLDEVLAGEISRHSRYGGIFAVIIIDLDSFKAYNDSYGHLAGDKLLKQVGSILKGAIRTSDQAFRYGGDEFALVLPQTTVDVASQVAERVRQRLVSKLKDGSLPITASLGLASWPADGNSAARIIAAADAALYRAKRSGGNQTQCASGMLLPLEEATGPGGLKEGEDNLSSIFAIVAAVDARNHYAGSHSKKVNQYAVALAEALGLPSAELTRVSTCALLHDIGKIGVSEKVLRKADKLNSAEWESVKVHPQLGATIASYASHLASCLSGIRHHHERYDGTGYPAGLKGENIPLEARILAIADAYTAMTSERPYAPTLTPEQAREELKQGAGTQFDPKLVEVFVKLIPETSSDKEVRLESGS
ncbi:MAG: diguanylate cyclase [Chloroflexota bacterium]